MSGAAAAVNADPCCEHCVNRLGFGPRRKRVLFLAVKHPEFDTPEFCGELVAQTDRNGQVRGFVRPKAVLPLVEPDS